MSKLMWHGFLGLFGIVKAQKTWLDMNHWDKLEYIRAHYPPLSLRECVEAGLLTKVEIARVVKSIDTRYDRYVFIRMEKPS